MVVRRPAIVAAVLLTLTACSGGDGQIAVDPPASSGVGGGSLPAVEVTDLHTGEPVDLAAQLPADQPLLVWFWAPH